MISDSANPQVPGSVFTRGNGMANHFSAQSGPVELLAVVVLYRLSAADSVAVQSLLRSADGVDERAVRLQILLYDNSPEAAPPSVLPKNTRFHSAARNRGLAGAYNYALEMAEAAGCSWLLTLDQDTAIPCDMLERFTALARHFTADDSIAAIVPQLLEGNVVQSPLYTQWRRPRRMAVGFSGFPDREITAMNSGSLWKVRHLRAMGGFSPDFWLDYLDYVLYHLTFRMGKRVYVSGTVGVEHRLSLADWKGRLSPERLQNILWAESAFHDIYKGRVEQLLLTLKFAALYANRKLKGEEAEFLGVIRGELLRRILQSRRSRVEAWRRVAALRVEQENQSRKYCGPGGEWLED